MRRLARPLLYLGVVAVVGGFSKIHAAYIGDYDLTGSSRFAWAITYVVLICITAYGFGLPDLARSGRARLTSAVTAVAVGALAISLVQLLVGDALLPRFVVFGSAGALVPWFLACSALSWTGRSALEARDRVVVVGDDALAAELEAELLQQPEKPAAVVASLTTRAAASVGDRARPLVEAVVDSSGSVVVLSAGAQDDEAVVAQAAALHEAGVRIRTRSLFYEEWLGKIPVEDLGRVALFFDIGELHRDRYGRMKRLVDLAAGLVGLVPLALVLPAVAVGDLVANRGPLFYVQDRVGRNGRVFRIVKFRTMRPDDGAPTEWTGTSDPRITPFGSLLRRSHLDELPQVLNMVRGDLSLVGPRPEQPRYVADLVQKLPYYDLRHLVRPGLTGWAQVKYGYAGDDHDAREKLQYDFHYLRRQSLVFDLRIVARTVRAVLGWDGR